MKRDAMEETQKLERPAPKLDDTQTLPALPGEAGEDPLAEAGRPRRHRGVRELAPVPMESRQEPAPAEGKAGAARRSGGKRAAVLAIGFLAALFLGFLLAGYSQERTERAANEQAHTEQQLLEKQAKLERDAKALEAEKARLEEEKRALEAKKQQALEASARAQGRSEQIGSETSSGVRGFFDKVTGKEKARQAQKAESDQAAAAAQSDAAQLDQSIEEAQRMLDDVNEKLDAAKTVQQEAGTALEKAKTAYDENKDTVDTVLSYAQTGAKMLGQFLFP